MQKVDGIVLAPLDRKAIMPSVEKLNSLKLPCAIIDSGIETDKILTFAATDNYQGGVLAAKRKGEILGFIVSKRTHAEGRKGGVLERKN